MRTDIEIKKYPKTSGVNSVHWPFSFMWGSPHFQNSLQRMVLSTLQVSPGWLHRCNYDSVRLSQHSLIRPFGNDSGYTLQMSQLSLYGLYESDTIQKISTVSMHKLY